MKLTQTYRANRKSGMTLLELTVVILVLLSLISILFVGARAWKKGSDRSANIMNIRNCQQAMRGHQNLYNLEEGTGAFTQTDLEDYLTMPTPPAAGLTYTPGTVVTAPGVLWLTVAATGDTVLADYMPPAADYADW